MLDVADAYVWFELHRKVKNATDQAFRTLPLLTPVLMQMESRAVFVKVSKVVTAGKKLYGAVCGVSKNTWVGPECK